MNRSILLLGHRGFIGSFLYENMCVDILEKKNVYSNGKKYNYIINCIGRPLIKYCEENIEETNYSNWLVIEDIKKNYPNSKIINFSTNAVYDAPGLNTEESNTTDAYVYVKQKLNGERAIKNGISFRIGTLFGHKFFQPGKLIEYIVNNDNIKLDDVVFNLTSMSQILKVIKFEVETQSLNGIYNLANLGCISHYDYGIEIIKILKLKKTIHKVEKLKREHNYGRYLMDVSKLNKIYPLTHWKTDSLIKI